MKAHEKRQNVDNDALGQKGRMRFFLNIFREKRIRPFWPTKQPGKANQRSKEVWLPSGQKGHAEKSVQTRNARLAMEKWEPCFADGRDVNCQQPLGRSVRCVLKHLKNTTGIQSILRDYYKQLYANKMDNLEDMDKLLERYNLPRLKIENMNRSITSNESETMIKNLPTKFRTRWLHR